MQIRPDQLHPRPISTVDWRVTARLHLLHVGIPDFDEIKPRIRESFAAFKKLGTEKNIVAE